MRSGRKSRLLSLALALVLALQLCPAALAASVTAPGSSEPSIRYYVENDGWHYADALPSKQDPMADRTDGSTHIFTNQLTLDKADESKVVLPGYAPAGAGILSQFDASGAATASGTSFTYMSASLNGNTTLMGYPSAELKVTAPAGTKITVTLSAVNSEKATPIAQGEYTASSALNAASTGKIELTKAYTAQDSNDFVAYQVAVPRGASAALQVTVTADKAITIHQDGGSQVTLPVVDGYETGYQGVATVGAVKNAPAVLYWLDKNIYVNYKDGEAEKWISVPADTPYTVGSDGAANFGAFSFQQRGNTAFKDGAVQKINGSGAYTQPIPTYRHILVATVPIEPVSDLLYLPVQKNLYQDIFMPTSGVSAGDVGNLPSLIYIHGFGGSYSQLKQDFAYEVLEHGYAVVGVDLRNYPSNYSPDYYWDVKGNIRHLRANAERYGLDPERIGIYGVSLGGNTSLMMAVSAGNQYLEGDVGGNLDVSSRVQAAVCGFAWSDAINFGADQRTDNANDLKLLGSMISGGDGENAPCAQAIDFYGPGKGYLVLRNYKEARNAYLAESGHTMSGWLRENNGKWDVVIDDEYIDKWFSMLGENFFTAGSATCTKGTYHWDRAYMEEKLTYAEAASPLYYVSPDDPSIMVFGGYGASANITNTQSTRTLKKLSEMGVPAVMAGNSMGNYGGETEVKASMLTYLDNTLKNRPAGVRASATIVDASTPYGYAVVNDLDVSFNNALVREGNELKLNGGFINRSFGTSLSANTNYALDSEELKAALPGVTIKTYTGETYEDDTVKVGYTTVTLTKSAPAAAAAKPSAKVEPTKVSLPGEYEGYTGVTYPNVVEKSVYVEVPAVYPGQVEFPSAPEYQDDPSYNAANHTIKLALTYVLPSQDGETAVNGSWPTVFEISRGGRGMSSSQYDAAYLVKHGYAWVMLEMRGCGASFGVNNSFASLENRLDVKYVMENWVAQQSWSNGSYAMEGGSNRGLIQWATATTAPAGLKAISPIVCNPDFYYQDYRNGASATPGSGANLSGSKVDAKVKSYEEWIEKPGVTFVDDDPEGRTAYQAYVYYTERNMPFTTYLLAPNLNRDQPNEYLYGEKVNLTIPAAEYSDEIKASGIQVHQMVGWYDSNATFMIAAANAWGGKAVIGPWGHGGTIRGGYAKNNATENATAADKVNVDVEQLRWFDYVLKGADNGYEDAPKFYYYVVNAAKGEEWRYSDTFPLDNSVNSVLYLAPESSGEVLDAALKLDGPQSNNGKLSLVKPGSSSVDYKVDVSINPEGFNNGDLSATGEMTPVDSKGLTYTSAPLANAAEIVGIPSVDLWISSTETDDADFVVYLEEVKADGTSHMITQGAARASHRTTGASDLWDSTEGLAGRYHTSLTADVNAALAQGLDTPVRLQFHLEAVAYRVSAGSSLRVTVTCANNAVYQHQMYYKTNADGSYVMSDDGKYVFMDEADLPTIKLYQGGDRASLVNIPIVENVSNTFNGTVTFADGSYTGPGTMYLFDNNWFLYANGRWTKLSTANGENAYTVNAAGAAVFTAGFTFLPEGSRVIKNGIAQHYQGGQAHGQPFPTRFNMNVDTMVNQTGNVNANMLLYLPVSKTLDINLFMPTGWKQGDAPVPVILSIHGFGGTCIDLDANLLNMLDEGYALAGVDLRNYPPNESPLYYQDIKGNIRWLRANAGWLGIDPDRIGIYGTSLGGNTSLMMLLSGGDPEMEGTVGGNLDVSSRVQAGICGYAWSDAIYFGLDQRNDNDYNFELMRSMISGGDGENAPCAQAVNFSGPGKGYLVLRNYLEARRAAEANGTLTQFLAQPYTLTIDKAYVDYWFPGQEGATNAFIGSGATVTLGTYTYDHAEMMAAVERAQKASPAYYASADDPVIVVFGGFGGSQNITNQQSVRTETAMQDAGAKAFYFGSSVTSWNDYTRYGNPAAIQAAFRTYWNHYLKGTPSGTKLVMTVGSNTAVVNYAERKISAALRLENGQPMFPAEVINLYLGTELTGYVTADQVKEASGATVTWNAEDKMAVIDGKGSIPKFADAASNHWASDGIVYNAVRGIMEGTAETLFAPDQAVTRAMAVTTLYRAFGSPAVSGTSRYSDAGAGLWYSNAILWAEQQGIVDIFSGSTFGVNEIITREELAVLLCRCADGTGSSASLAGFADRTSVSSTAADAMGWAVSQGIINGKPGSLLAPKDSLTRAELAVILQRYLQK